MRQKHLRLIIAVFVIAVLAITLSSCGKKTDLPPIYLNIDGDIIGGLEQVDLAKMQASSYTYEDDGTQQNGEGWPLNDVLHNISPLYTNNRLMITSKDGVSVLVEYPLTGTLYIYLNDENKLCAKGLNYPRACGIKDISELTFITSDTPSSGYKVLTKDAATYISGGNAKLKLYTLEAANIKDGNTADKYVKAADNSVSGFTGKNTNIVYYQDYDIAANASARLLSWQQGKLFCSGGNGSNPSKAVFGFVTGTNKLISDAYYDMKAAIDADKKVMFILPDGFSWQQANTFSDQLTTLKPGANSALAASTHLSISPVALAAMVTGQSPLVNGVHFDEGESRAVLPLAADDIFKYAADKGKSVSYIEGSGNLILTSVTPQYSVSDEAVYNNAKQAKADGKELIFVHFHEIDDTNHQYGPLSSKSQTKLLIIESYIRDLINGFDGVVIIVPDHGHNTLYDQNNNAYGKHGMFTASDMYVPYYVFGDL